MDVRALGLTVRVVRPQKNVVWIMAEAENAKKSVEHFEIFLQ